MLKAVSKLRSDTVTALTIIICVIFSFSADLAFATEDAPALNIIHKPLRSQDLPAPRSKVVLRIGVPKVKDLSANVKANVVSDGRLMQIGSNRAYLNDRDIPTFEFEFNAPLAEIRYQFLVPASTSQITTSEEYSVRRSCLPSNQLASSSVPGPITGLADAQAMLKQAQDLEEELKQYDKVLVSINEFKKAIKK